jgi:hypothetical protein
MTLKIISIGCLKIAPHSLIQYGVHVEFVRCLDKS